MCEFRLLIVSCFMLFALAAKAEEKISLDWHQVPLPMALQMLAEASFKNIVVDPAVNGVVDLNVSNTQADDVIEVLLSTHDLVSVKQGELLYIATPASLIKKHQAVWRWQQTHLETEDLQVIHWQLRYAKVEEVVHILQQGNSLLSKRGRMNADLRTNTLFVEDVPERIAVLQARIKQLDVALPQILIEARLASVDTDAERDLGIDFKARDREQATNDLQDGAPKGQFTLAWLPLADHARLDINLHALESSGRGELLSSPTLFTNNQKTASIEAGEEIPYQEISRSGATGVAFKKAVLSLKVTPELLPGNKVLLTLQINQDKPSNRLVLGVPAITTRQIITTVLVNNGQTVVLGGIYERLAERASQGVPYLDKMPIVGTLFTVREDRDNKRELLVFVTPIIKMPVETR